MSEYIPVYVANGQLDAEMIRGFLEASGIPAMISQESVGKVFGLAAGPLGEVNVLVPVEKSAEALDLLRSMESGDFIDNEANEDFSRSEEGQDDEEPPEGADDEEG